MFTGIIQAVGQVRDIQPHSADTRFRIDAKLMPLDDSRIGDSIAVNGVCLTATEIEGSTFWVDISSESLAKTSLQAIQVGSPVNLEKALTLSTPLGGHLVSGHVDGLGEITRIETSGRANVYQVRIPGHLAKYVAQKGSICIDGVSLTVNQVSGHELSVTIIPHTQTQTIISSYQVGTKVNIEIDLIARYLERLLLGERAADASVSTQELSKAFLKENGFIKS